MSNSSYTTILGAILQVYRPGSDLRVNPAVPVAERVRVETLTRWGYGFHGFGCGSASSDPDPDPCPTLSWVCASGAFPVLLWAHTPTHALRAAFSRSLLLSVPDARSRSAPGASSPSLSLSAAAAARRAAERAEPKALPPKPQNLLDSSPVVVHANGDDH
ncbi:hypothetical protein GGX14DRAFT_395210 [Mycena pura]|uniref:Uncharacterized protein n=1 Tax=Mycena pura TaxID=153505 RepID=A0AAD6VEP4_9AGAR|nr:hypothetical protein GGX14DRAFT_395210 [Mycena pura]